MKRLTVIAISLIMSVMPSGVAHAAKKKGLCPQWHSLALSVGWRSKHLLTLDRLMHRESRCWAGALNSTLNRDGSSDYGLMQINDKTWCLPSKYAFKGYLQAQKILKDCNELLIPAVNLAAALAVYEAAGNSFSPWGE
ncbi:C-type lysozyme/alpha-lactalbumin family protein [Freshwater phage uvFW-CGR-AMD-COM-C429]|nr:C-type lysozyme/alpha-lactalbumin family protein [Freshwater phage uvFW-CGR-AMD-COM-C429]